MSYLPCSPRMLKKNTTLLCSLVGLISPYIIFQFCNTRSPDLHIVGGQTLYVFGSHILYLWGVSLFWSRSIPFTLWLKRVQKNFYSLILTLIHCVVAISHIFASA